MVDYYTADAELVVEAFLKLDSDRVGISNACLVSQAVFTAPTFDLSRAIAGNKNVDEGAELRKLMEYINYLREKNIAPFQYVIYENIWYPSVETSLPEPRFNQGLSDRVRRECGLEKIWHPLNVLRSPERVYFRGIKGPELVKMLQETASSEYRAGRYVLNAFSADLQPYSEDYGEDSSIKRAEGSLTVSLGNSSRIGGAKQLRPSDLENLFQLRKAALA